MKNLAENPIKEGSPITVGLAYMICSIRIITYKNSLMCKELKDILLSRLMILFRVVGIVYASPQTNQLITNLNKGKPV